VGELAEAIQAATRETVEVAFVDQGYTGQATEDAGASAGIRLVVVKLPDTKRGFVLLPRRWVVERSFAWLTRFRRLAKDYERLEETFKGVHLVAFATPMLTAAETARGVKFMTRFSVPRRPCDRYPDEFSLALDLGRNGKCVDSDLASIASATYLWVDPSRWNTIGKTLCT
jgi:transposase